VALPVSGSISPMLGRLVRELPLGDLLYEPKWDGFRCIALRDGEEVELRSRNGRPFARYFPEIVAALGSIDEPRFVLDGELVLVVDGRFDFPALMGRLHPAASLVARLAAERPATLVVFDAIAVGDDDLRAQPFAERRARLERLLRHLPPGIELTPQTADPATAERWLRRPPSGGVDGVMAKERSQPYVEGARRVLKVKRERTADCVLAGFRVVLGAPAVSSLLLGLYDDGGVLVHVGVCSSFSERRRRELYGELRELRVPIEAHPWRGGYLLSGGVTGRLPGSAGRWDPASMPLDWVPVDPRLVCEVAYEQVDGSRFRHPARFLRWRPDREPASCTLGQLVEGGAQTDLVRDVGG
jgi:ATP-dependent DNA ligase